MSGRDIHEGATGRISCERMMVGVRDGARLSVRHYRRENARRRGAAPVLCVPPETGHGAQHHAFLLELLDAALAPTEAWAVDLRGRGTSSAKDVADTDLSTDVADLVDVADALALHHADIVADGFSVVTVLKALLPRPGLVRRLVMNDGAPELDGVARAHRAMLMNRESGPTSRADALALLRRTQDGFTIEDDGFWNEMLDRGWHEAGKYWLPAHDIALERTTNATDFDEAQPDGWKELGILKDRPALLVRGEGSRHVSDAIVARMQGVLRDLRVETAPDQGHVPMLDRGALPNTIRSFLTA